MKVKFVSKLNRMSEIVFLVLSKKNALKNIGLSEKNIKEITKWVPIFRICGALSLIIFCVILIPKIGFIGAAYSVLFAFVLMSFAIYIRTHNIYEVPYNWRGIFYPIVFLMFVQVYEFDFLSRVILSIR